MAWRLDDAVEHGLIDNTVEGTTSGKIWLVGREEPLILSLNGDCWRDLAGTILEFENPHPVASAEASSLDTEQTGIIGDMTASRKARVPDLSDGELSRFDRQGREIPFKWRNVLYLEWFSEINGRVLIESVGYKLQVSEAHWKMDEDLEEAQKLANLSAMRDFLSQIIQRSEADEDPDSGKSHKLSGQLNEYEWEERLKESDRLTDAYQEVLEKYMEDTDSERKEAFVMGWDGLLGAMADGEESLDWEEEDFEGDDEQSGEEWRDSENESDSDDSDENDEEEWLSESHPLQTKAREVSLRAFELVKRGDSQDSPSERLVSSLMQVSGKLAGILHGHGTDYEPEAGFILAVLKRCLNWTNDTIGACDELIGAEENATHRAALESLKAETFEIRAGIIEMRQELKKG